MSRIGRLHITLPAGVSVEFKDQVVTVKGPKGELSRKIESKNIAVNVDGNEIHVVRSSEDKQTKSMHGLYRVLINDMVQGVVTPFAKTLIIDGVGYKASVQGSKLVMNLGLSHPVEYVAPAGITIACPDQNTVVVTGISKEVVGQVAATIKSKRHVEPYHGYGIHYSTEVVVKKEGKTAGK